MRNGSEDREPKYSHYLMKSAGRLMSTRGQWLAKQRMAVSRSTRGQWLAKQRMAVSRSTRGQWLAKQRMAVSRNDHILTFREVFKALLTSWNSFNVLFPILLTLLNMADRPNTCVTPTNSNAHVTCWFKGHRDAYEACTVNMYT